MPSFKRSTFNYSPKQLGFEPLEIRSLMSASGLLSLGDVGALNSANSSYDNSQILVRFRDEHAKAPQPAIEGTQIGAALGLVSGLHSVSLSGVTVEEALAAYQASPAVLYAQPDYRIDLSLVSNDPGYTGQYLWGLDNSGQDAGTVDADIDAPEAWNITTGSRELIVAVIDSGVDYNHPDLAANIWTNAAEVARDGLDNDGNGYVDDVHGYDFFNWDSDPMDDNGHGTHVAGTIGAVGNNGRGVAGVSWGVQLMPLKFLGADGSGSLSGAISALNYAVQMGAQISNNSWGGGGYVGSLYEAIQSAQGANHLFVAAAGNDNLNNDRYASYPANYALDNVISVAATDNRDQMASFSHWGATTVDLAAPGVDIVSTTPGNTYSYMSGTSMATPHVSGAAALLWSADHNLTLAEVKDRLLRGADPIGTIGPNAAKPTLTGGRLNAFNSLRADLEWQSLVAPSTVYAGELFSLDGAYRISGSGAADFDVSYYASVDNLFGNSDDMFLASETPSAANMNSVGVHTYTSAAMSLLEAGTYYVFARLDGANHLAEHREINNVSLPIPLRVDTLPTVTIDAGNLGVGAVIAPIIEGDMVTLNASVPAEIVDAQIEWQVTGGPVEILGSAGEPTFRFRPLDGSAPEGKPYTITLSVAGSLMGQTEAGQFVDTTSVLVQNAAPAIESLAASTTTVIGETVHFAGTFSDPGSDMWHGTAIVTAPNGSTRELPLIIGADSKSYEFELAFAELGPHIVTVTVSDGQEGSPSGVSSIVSVEAVPGDYNKDGSIDAADYVVWRKYLAPAADIQTGYVSDESAHSDGHSVWRENFGKSFTAPAAEVELIAAKSIGGSAAVSTDALSVEAYDHAFTSASVNAFCMVGPRSTAINQVLYRPALRPSDFLSLPLVNRRQSVSASKAVEEARDVAFETPDAWADGATEALLNGILAGALV
jgi:subtilisin family serine protease